MGYSGMSSSRRKYTKTGHRSWGARGQPVPGTHTGDIMSREARSRVMARIRGKNTKPEKALAALLTLQGLVFEQHARDLPGVPDFVFRSARLAVFVDGNFWHGWRFPLWEHKLSAHWREKISATRNRDQRNFRKLRRAGWKVMRIWEHQIERSPRHFVQLIITHLRSTRLARA